jgi:hypothetical protein
MKNLTIMYTNYLQTYEISEEALSGQGSINGQTIAPLADQFSTNLWSGINCILRQKKAANAILRYF